MILNDRQPRLADGSHNLGKRITDIKLAENGTISFHLEVDDSQDNHHTAVEPAMFTERRARKWVRNGQLLIILPDGKTYTVTGQEVK